MSSSFRQALLLVDGYNVIGAWHHLQQTRDRDGLESARRELIETLINFTATEGHHTQVVFDAHYQNTPGYSEVYTASLSVHYTAFAQTADTYIEKFCASFFRQVEQSYQRLIVATSDRAQRLTVVGYGAEWLSVQRLAGEIEISSNKIKRKKRPHKSHSGRFLFNALDPEAQERLREMREGR
jgi:uncharacterized protein